MLFPNRSMPGLYKLLSLMAGFCLITGLCFAAIPAGSGPDGPRSLRNGADDETGLDAEGLLPPEACIVQIKTDYVKSELILKLKEKSALGVIQKDHRILSAEPVFGHLAGEINHAGSKFARMRRSAVQRGLDRWFLLRLQSGVKEDEVLREYKALPYVEFVQRNYIYEPDVDPPNDPDYSEQYAHQLCMAESAWQLTTGSEKIAVAVIGTGVAIDHPDLFDNIWINAHEVPDNDEDDDGNGYIDDVNGWDFRDTDNNPRPVPGVPADWEHETHIAGIIAAVGNNGLGVCGVNWVSSIMPLRVAYTSDNVAAAIEYARTNGARVINMSFGNYDKDKYGDFIVKDMLDKAYSEGVLLVATAGNDKLDRRRYPAALYNVIAVAATDQNDERAVWGNGYYGSNFGPWVDIAAPGSDILSTWPWSTYETANGTSFAAPYVAGVGALLLALDPKLDGRDVRAIMEHTTDPVVTETEYISVGTGRVSAGNALWSSGEKHPLGEIVAPENKERMPENKPLLSVTFLARGDYYWIGYHPYGRDRLIIFGQGKPEAHAGSSELITLPLRNPGLGSYMLRLIVKQGNKEHLDSKLFSVEGGYQENWPTPPLGNNRFFMSCAICMDIDEDGKNEIIQSSYGENGNGGYTYIWNEDGTDLQGWPQYISADPSCSTSAVGDVDGDGDYEVVTTTYNHAYTYVWHWQDGTSLPGWPQYFGNPYKTRANPVLADLDGDGDSEIIIAAPKYGGDDDYIYAYQHDGTEIWRYYMDNVQAPMAAADLDGDGDVEIAVCSWQGTHIIDHNGNPVRQWSGGSHKPLVIADLDGDGELEVIGATSGYVRALHVNGDVVWQAPVSQAGGYGAMSAGDVDGDGLMEVYLANRTGYDLNHKVHAFDFQGNPLTAQGFPKEVLGRFFQNAPAIGDIDGDGSKEMLVCSDIEMLFAWDRRGEFVDSFPRLIEEDINTTATIADLDLDGDTEVMFGTYGATFYVFDLPGKYKPENIDWGMYRHDPQCSGLALQAPKLKQIKIISPIFVGRPLRFQLDTTNPDNLPTHYYVRQMPAGASFDEQTRYFTWTPTPDQAGQIFKFYLFVTDGIRQDHQPVSVEVLDHL